MLLYEIAVGRVPYDAEPPIAVLFKHIDDPLPMPRASNPDVPEAVERVILRALAKHADERFANAVDMVQALQLAIPERTSEAGKTVIAPPPAALEPTAEHSPPPANAAPPEEDAVHPPPARRRSSQERMPAQVARPVLRLLAPRSLSAPGEKYHLIHSPLNPENTSESSTTEYLDLAPLPGCDASGRCKALAISSPIYTNQPRY